MKRKIGVTFSQVMRLHWLISYHYMHNIKIHPGQVSILLFLHDNNGHSQKEIAESLKVSPATITVSIQRLIKNGYLVKEKDKIDKRKSIILITEEGKSLCSNLRNARDNIENICLKDFSQEESEELLRLISKIKNNLLEEHDKLEDHKKLHKDKENKEMEEKMC